MGFEVATGQSFDLGEVESTLVQDPGVKGSVVDLCLTKRSLLPVGHLLNFAKSHLNRFWVSAFDRIVEANLLCIAIFDDERKPWRVFHFQLLLIDILQIDEPLDLLESRCNKALN